MLKNKKGFTLIELIIVVAIMAVLVALLAPNVLKYLEKSKVGKDINSLDAVRTGVEAEIMDEDLSRLQTDDGDTDDVIEGKLLSAIKSATGDDWAKLSSRLFGEEMVLTDNFATAEIFTSKAAEGAVIKVYLNGKGAVAIAAVDSTTGKAIEYDQDNLIVSSKFNKADLDKLDCVVEDGE